MGSGRKRFDTFYACSVDMKEVSARWDETLDIGSDAGTPVSDDYPGRGNEFTGNVVWVQIDAGEADSDHLIDPMDRLRIIMARQ